LQNGDDIIANHWAPPFVNSLAGKVEPTTPADASRGFCAPHRGRALPGELRQPEELRCLPEGHPHADRDRDADREPRDRHHPGRRGCTVSPGVRGRGDEGGPRTRRIELSLLLRGHEVLVRHRADQDVADEPDYEDARLTVGAESSAKTKSRVPRVISAKRVSIYGLRNP